ncbi:MAG: SDR family oxidoreductase [Verrucomicrobia bacterium]|nr:SDR family oxidoreductase [Verrucomicrobiota bacterium]
MTDLTGRVVFITGGGKGIGRALALAFARAGADVAICGRDTGALKETARETEATGRRALAVRADVADEAQVNAAVAQVLDAFGSIDVLINNAGEFLLKEFVELTAEEWDRVLGTNLRGMFLVCKTVVAHMIERGSGHIFNVSSLGGRRPLKRATAYCASKYGVVGFSKALARELKPHGIKLQIVYPYFVDSHGEVDWSAEDPKLTQWITPEEIAAVVVENACRPHRVLIEDLVFEPAVDATKRGR